MLKTVLHVIAPAPVRDVPPEPSVPPESRIPATRRLLALLILTVGAVFPMAIAAISPHAPRTRNIHIEAYRYGFSPSRIHANRGDRLRLTFSTRDTGQSFFLQDYDLHVAITPGNKLVSVQRLSRPDDPPALMETVEIVAGLPGWQGQLVSKSQFRNHTYNGPLHGTERGELIVSPNFLLYGALGLLAAIPLAGLIMYRSPSPAEKAGRRGASASGNFLDSRCLAPGGTGGFACPPAESQPRLPDPPALASAGRRPTGGSQRRPLNLFRPFPWLKRLVKAPSFQFNLALPMLGVFWFVILAGLLGTKVSGRNAGPMIVWVLWLSALIVLLVPIGGRIWCTVCPLPLLGEWLQRLRLTRNPAELENKSPRRILGVPLIWPAWLSNPWPRVVLFLLLGTFSTTIVALPPATSWMLIGLVILAIVTSGFPEQRLFCRYLCPINSYISLYSTTGRVTVRSVSSQTCSACNEKFCLTGSVKGWGCPYGLCVGEIDRNNDCGACMECVKTCAYDNVAVFWRSEGWDKDVASYGEVWQAIVMFALACLYSIINQGAWDKIRDWTDLVDKGNWGTFSVYALVVWVACLGLLPLLWYLLTRIGIGISGSRLLPDTQFRTTSASLIPLGMAFWIAFALATVSSMMTFVLQSLSDPFNWGWDLLGMAGSRWHIVWSPAIPWLQVACVLTGAAYAMRTLYGCWLDARSKRRRAIMASLPLGSFLWMAAAGMIFFFAG